MPSPGKRPIKVRAVRACASTCDAPRGHNGQALARTWGMPALLSSLRQQLRCSQRSHWPSPG